MLITPHIHASRILQYLYLFLSHKSQALPFLHGRLSVPLCSVPCGCWSLSSRPPPPHGTVNHFPHHVICVLSHRYNYLRLPLLKYITTRRNSNSHCQTGNRLHNAPNSFSYLGGYSQLMTSRPYTYPYHFRIIT